MGEKKIEVIKYDWSGRVLAHGHCKGKKVGEA